MKVDEIITEDLRKWFKEKWVRFGPDGKIRGACGGRSDSEGKPKCLPQSKAQSLGKKGRSKSAAKKRREDPNPERKGKAKNVATKTRTMKEAGRPTNPDGSQVGSEQPSANKPNLLNIIRLATDPKEVIGRTKNSASNIAKCLASGGTSPDYCNPK